MALELPVIEFIKTRLNESDSTLEVRAGTAYYDLFIKPQQIMLQPLIQAMEVSLNSQSVARIQNLDDPDAFDEELVDQLVENLYVFRDQGDLATCTVRVYYSAPSDKQFPALSAEFLSSGGFSYFNSEDVTITKAEMNLNTEGDLYYVDIVVQAQAEGEEYNAEVGDIVAFVNDVEAVLVSNTTAAIGGRPKETNTEVLSRVQQSIGVRDFETGKGINAIINEKFPGIFDEIFAIGFGDPEMMRDIVYNAHVGGNTDIYLKAATGLTTLQKDIVGLVFDETRNLGKTTYKQLTATTYGDPAADLKTPFIVVGSMSVKSDTIETGAKFTSANVPAVTGINLTGAEYVKIKLDSNGSYMNIKVSGANPAATQKFEIINSINAALGQTVAKAFGANQILLESQVIGLGSQLNFATPDAPRTDATPILFPDLLASPYNYVSGVTGINPNPAATILGDVAVTYVETVDYSVDYLEGKIIKLPGSSILSGETIVGPLANGQVTTGSDLFNSPVAGQFAAVNVGDSVTITASTGIAPGTYIVKEKVSDQSLKLQNVLATGVDNAVSYSIVSNQVVVLKYEYHPLSIDIGGKVLLPDGRTRGVRAGREDYTITNLPFIDIISIEEIDSDTLEGLGVFLKPTNGYGSGGYGKGPYGIGLAGDYRFIVNSPKDRFSMYDDALIVIDPVYFGKSYRVTYYTSTPVQAVHDVSRSDLERVTGADVLAKNFVPAFVDVEIPIRRDPANINTPSNSELEDLISFYINSVPVDAELQASDIVRILENEGVSLVKVPFIMYMEVINTDGSTSKKSDENVLVVDEVVLPKETTNYVTNRIAHFYARTVSIVEEA